MADTTGAACAACGDASGYGCELCELIPHRHPGTCSHSMAPAPGASWITLDGRHIASSDDPYSAPAMVAHRAGGCSDCGAGIIRTLLIGDAAPNGFADGIATMTASATDDIGYRALVAAIAPRMLVAHRSYCGELADGSIGYTVRLTIGPMAAGAPMA